MLILNNLTPNQIFFPKHFEELERIKKEEVSFAYYTTAETAYKLIKNQELWLRSITAMNDYTEFTHGKKILIDLINNSNEGKNLKEIFNELMPDLFDEVFSDFQRFENNLRNDFQIMCVTEHHIKKNAIGRLSMWRAYGGKNGIAIIFKREFFELLVETYLDFSNVAYLEKENINAEIKKLNDSITKNKSNLIGLGKVDFKSHLFNIFKFAALCNKHIGFEEEKEWRLVAMDSIHESHEYVCKEVETINGVPQSILKVKLEKLPVGSQLKEMIEKVIIGPCRHPNLVYDSIAFALKSIGIQNPDSLIDGSDIPYRANY